MFKKIITCLLALLVLFDCSFDNKNQNTIIIKMWHYYNGTAKTALDNLVLEFNNTIGKKRGIIVDAYSIGSINELSENLLASANKTIGSDEMPNIFASYSDSAYELDELGVVLNLDEYYSEKELSEYRKEFIEEGYFREGDGLKIIPISKASEIMFINYTDFDKFAKDCNVDIDELSSWKGLGNVAKNYYEYTDAKTEAKNDGKALFGVDSMANFMLIATKQLGQELYHLENDKVVIEFDEETAKKIWDRFYIPFINGYFGAIGRFRSDDTKCQDLLMYVGSTSSSSYFPKRIETSTDNYEIEGKTLKYPSFVDGEKYVVSQGAGMVVSKSDKAHEDASVLFLKWLNEEDQNLDFSIDTGYLPTKLAVMDFELTKNKIAEKNIMADKILLDTLKTTYDMFDEYELYTNKPFIGSYEARFVLENNLLNYAKKDLEALNIELQIDSDKAKLVAKYETYENFKKWYDNFMIELNKAIDK